MKRGKPPMRHWIMGVRTSKRKSQQDVVYTEQKGWNIWSGDTSKNSREFLPHKGAAAFQDYHLFGS